MATAFERIRSLVDVPKFIGYAAQPLTRRLMYYHCCARWLPIVSTHDCEGRAKYIEDLKRSLNICLAARERERMHAEFAAVAPLALMYRYRVSDPARNPLADAAHHYSPAARIDIETTVGTDAHTV